MCMTVWSEVCPMIQRTVCAVDGGGGDLWFMTNDAIGYSHCELLSPRLKAWLHRENGCKLIIKFYLSQDFTYKVPVTLHILHQTVLLQSSTLC